MPRPDVVAAPLHRQVLAPAGAKLVLAEWVAQASVGEEPRQKAPLPAHEEDEAWQVLEGTLRVRVGDDQAEMPAGGAVIVPGGTAHTFWNPGPEPARQVLVMGARTYALIQALHASDDRSPARIRQLFEQHGARLIEEAPGSPEPDRAARYRPRVSAAERRGRVEPATGPALAGRRGRSGPARRPRYGRRGQQGGGVGTPNPPTN